LIGKISNNYTWAILKTINIANLSFINVDTNLNLTSNIIYPNVDTTTTTDNSG
jgi:hypothetical protein